jgi:hypothetical protein
MGGSSNYSSLQPDHEHVSAKTEIGPGKKFFWQSDKVEKEPDAKLRLRADLGSLSFLVILRELLPTIGIIAYVFL